MQTQRIFSAHNFTLYHNELFIKNEMGVVGLRLKYEVEGKSILKLGEPKKPLL
jgi:DNA polymerase V